MLIFGHSGYPLILFPTSMGRYFQSKDSKLVDSAAWFIEQGIIKVYCPDSLDFESWYNCSLKPSEKVEVHMLYEKMIKEDVVQRALEENGFSKVAMAGCCFGAYHAANFTFKNPSLVSFLITMGGEFDIKFFLDNYFDETCYLNSPQDFIADLQDPALKELGVVLGVGGNDYCKAQNMKMSQALNNKGIDHWLDVREGDDHNWEAWRKMFPSYLSKIPYPTPITI